MEKRKIDRINELGRLGRVRPLTPAETEEQRLLREAYIREFRALIRGERVPGSGAVATDAAHDTAPDGAEGDRP